MDHRAFLSSLDDREKRALTSRANAPGLIHLIAHVGLILIAGTLNALQVPGWPLLLVVQGVLIIFLFTLEHEATHQTPFANTHLNEWVGRVCGLLILLPFTWFRYFHLAHHRHTNDPDADPELQSPKPETPLQIIWHVSGVSYWRDMTWQIILNALGRASAPYLPASAARRIVIEARVMITAYVLAAASLTVTPLLLWVWIVPLVLGQPFLRVYLLAEHGRCPMVANMFENTRTTFTNRIVRFLAWNMPYHAEHHAYPQVPFHKLPELHALTQAHLRVTENGYIRFARSYLAPSGTPDQDR